MIVLASTSPRRRDLLSSIGLTFDVRSPDVDETLLPAEDAFDGAERLAREKARAVAASADDLVIAADTLVVLEGQALGKPKDAAEATSMLRALSGRRHVVVTGVAVRRGDALVSGRDLTDVTFAQMSEDEIERYVATGEPLDRAGAYAVQGIGGLFVSGLSGSPSNVVGLPVRLVVKLARDLDVDLLPEKR